MNVKLICCAVIAVMLLCGCQASMESQNIMEDPPALEQSEQELPPSDDRAKAEEKEEISPYPPAPPVCELAFTETESFPFPFEDELLTDPMMRLLLSTEQALYDYDTMWQLLEENYPYLEAIKRDLGIDWEEVKAEYRQILEGRASYGYIWQGSFLQTIDDCLREFQSVGHLFPVSVDFRVTLLDIWKDYENAPYQNLRKIVGNPKSELFYQYEQRLRYPGSGGSNPDPEKDEPISVEGLTVISQDLSTGYVGGEVPYLKIESFLLWDDAAQAALEDFFSSISQEEHLIIDVRGNGGGNDSAWSVGIVPFLAQKEYEFNYK